MFGTSCSVSASCMPILLVWAHNSGRVLKEDVGPASLLETCSSDRIRKTCESLNSLQLPGHNRDSLGLGKVPFPPYVKLTARGGAKIITSTCSRTTFRAIGIVRHGLAHESGAAGRARSLIHDSRCVAPIDRVERSGSSITQEGSSHYCIPNIHILQECHNAALRTRIISRLGKP